MPFFSPSPPPMLSGKPLLPDPKVEIPLDKFIKNPYRKRAQVVLPRAYTEDEVEISYNTIDMNNFFNRYMSETKTKTKYYEFFLKKIYTYNQDTKNKKKINKTNTSNWDDQKWFFLQEILLETPIEEISQVPINDTSLESYEQVVMTRPYETAKDLYINDVSRNHILYIDDVSHEISGNHIDPIYDYIMTIKGTYPDLYDNWWTDISSHYDASFSIPPFRTRWGYALEIDNKVTKKLLLKDFDKQWVTTTKGMSQPVPVFLDTYIIDPSFNDEIVTNLKNKTTAKHLKDGAWPGDANIWTLLQDVLLDISMNTIVGLPNGADGGEGQDARYKKLYELSGGSINYDDAKDKYLAEVKGSRIDPIYNKIASELDEKIKANWWEKIKEAYNKNTIKYFPRFNTRLKFAVEIYTYKKEYDKWETDEKNVQKFFETYITNKGLVDEIKSKLKTKIENNFFSSTPLSFPEDEAIWKLLQEVLVTETPIAKIDAGTAWRDVSNSYEKVDTGPGASYNVAKGSYITDVSGRYIDPVFDYIMRKTDTVKKNWWRQIETHYASNHFIPKFDMRLRYAIGEDFTITWDAIFKSGRTAYDSIARYINKSDRSQLIFKLKTKTQDEYLKASAFPKENKIWLYLQEILISDHAYYIKNEPDTDKLELYEKVDTSHDSSYNVAKYLYISDVSSGDIDPIFDHIMQQEEAVQTKWWGKIEKAYDKNKYFPRFNTRLEYAAELAAFVKALTAAWATTSAAKYSSPVPCPKGLIPKDPEIGEEVIHPGGSKSNKAIFETQLEDFKEIFKALYSKLDNNELEQDVHSCVLVYFYIIQSVADTILLSMLIFNKCSSTYEDILYLKSDEVFNLVTVIEKFSNEYNYITNEKEKDAHVNNLIAKTLENKSLADYKITTIIRLYIVKYYRIALLDKICTNTLDFAKAIYDDSSYVFNNTKTINSIESIVSAIRPNPDTNVKTSKYEIILEKTKTKDKITTYSQIMYYKALINFAVSISLRDPISIETILLGLTTDIELDVSIKGFLSEHQDQFKILYTELKSEIDPHINHAIFTGLHSSTLFKKTSISPILRAEPFVPNMDKYEDIFTLFKEKKPLDITALDIKKLYGLIYERQDSTSSDFSVGGASAASTTGGNVLDNILLDTDTKRRQASAKNFLKKGNRKTKKTSK